MGTNFEDLEEQQYLERRERRRQRMLAEKRKKQRRQRMAVLFVCGIFLAAGVFWGARSISGMLSAKEDTTANEKVQEMVTPEVMLEAQAASKTDAAQANTSAVQADGKEYQEKKIYAFTENEETFSVFCEEVNSPYALLINDKTNVIVGNKGGNERISPASMTKVLTLLVAAEHIEESDLEDTFTMTLEITDYSYVNDCSNAGFLDGEQVKVRDLFYGTILPSGGDAAVGLATYVAGSHEAFVDLMNEKLEELGLSKSAHFTNCVGLYDENHYCTLYDLAIIMKVAMENELCREILGERCYTTGITAEHPEGITLSNWFLRRIEDKDTGGEVIGGKTGFVVESGSCAVSYSIQESGTPYICVTAGAYSSWRCIYDHVEIYKQYAK